MSLFAGPTTATSAPRNLHLARVLFGQTFALVNVERSDPANREFVFRNSFDRARIVERFNSKGPILVDACKVIFCRKLVRGKINGESLLTPVRTQWPGIRAVIHYGRPSRIVHFL